MSAVVIDASAGAEIVANTRRGQALAGLLPAGAEGWVPEHFYAEVLGVLRRRLLMEQALTEEQAAAALGRLRAWRLHHASVAPLLDAAWAYRHNMTAADALYVVTTGSAAVIGNSPGGGCSVTKFPSAFDRSHGA